MKNKVQLITYIDRLSGSGLEDFKRLIDGPFASLFGGVHLLPFFNPIDGSDAGFDPIDHTQVDPRLGSWNDLAVLASSVEVMADLIVNHMSSRSPQFEDFSRNGENSSYAGLFLTYNSVFPDGATEADLLRIYRPRPGLPFTYATLETGEKRLLWTTFTSQQIDIDVESPQGRAYLDSILDRFHTAGVRAIRMDAVGYAIKRAGTNSFMVPQTFDFIHQLASRAHARGIEVLVEIHSYYKKQVEIASRVDWVYDFALPPLVLHALLKADAEPLAQWIAIRPRNAVTVLDTHDGIGVIDVGADADGSLGLLTPAQIHELVESIHSLSKGQSKMATGAAASNLDLYQVNCTYLDALGGDEVLYLIARAIQFFVPGIPQIYYVGLLAGANDLQLLKRTGVGRDINRHYYSASEVTEALERPVVKRLIELIRLRNNHPAFDGECIFTSHAQSSFTLHWVAGTHWISLSVDLAQRSATIEHSTDQPSQSSTLRIH